MILKSRNFTEKDAKEISLWRYPNEYEIYNLPEWNTMVKENFSLCSNIKRKNFTAYITKNNELIGFTNLLDEGDWIFLGIGVKPQFCNQGIGKMILKLTLKKCEIQFPNKPIALEVRTWNLRAINCYKSQGFKIDKIKQTKTFIGLGEFYVMKYTH